MSLMYRFTLNDKSYMKSEINHIFVLIEKLNQLFIIFSPFL